MSTTTGALSSKARAAGLIAAGVVAGGVLAGTLAANAAGSGTSTTTATPSYQQLAGAPPGAAGPGAPGDRGSAPVRGDETTPSDSIVATLTNKAEARVSGGTVFRVETDAGDGAYEAHMQKSDGTLVTVKFDKDLNITAVEDGMGKGDRAPAGGTAPSTSGSSA